MTRRVVVRMLRMVAVGVVVIEIMCMRASVTRHRVNVCSRVAVALGGGSLKNQ